MARDTELTDAEFAAAVTAPRSQRREFLPEEVRRSLGADNVLYMLQGNQWHLVVWFGPYPTVDQIVGRAAPSESLSYQAWSPDGFTTNEAIMAIRRQRPEVQHD